MDPYLEHPSLWPDVHNRLIAYIADALTPKVAPNYYVRLERRAYLVAPDDLAFIGRPDVSVISPTWPQAKPDIAAGGGGRGEHRCAYGRRSGGDIFRSP
ncbi:MAG: hypothetical protein BroJett015_35500 [Chloroflexota bacterium]|nr:MAG: hypothetical protein BroJett015_35500 [Chloroflexota bacterium]